MSSLIDKSPYSEDLASRFDPETNRQARIPSALGYLFFVIPLVMCPDSKFARYHANQSLIMFFLLVIAAVTVSFIPNVIGFILMMLMMLYIIVFSIRGFVLALQCKARRIPLLGKLIIIQFDYFYTFS
jgi:uncharacterized membrane protein